MSNKRQIELLEKILSYKRDAMKAIKTDISQYYNGILTGLVIAYKITFKDELFYEGKILHKDSVNYLECLILKHKEGVTND